MVCYIVLTIVRLAAWAVAVWLAVTILGTASPAIGVPCYTLRIAAIMAVVSAVVAGYTSGPRWLSRLLPLGPLGRDGRRVWRAAKIQGDRAKMARRLAWRWPSIMANSRLTTKDAGVNRARGRYPDILEFREVPKGLALVVEPIAQVPAGEIAAHADNIAAALKLLRCGVKATSTHLIELTLVDRDPLAGAREADWTGMLP